MLTHLACIMDGNRRWAKRKGWLPWIGHRHGAQAITRVVDFCLDKKIAYVSLYTFSLENFKRSAQEIDYLFDMMLEQADTMLSKYKEQGVRVRFIGDRSLIPARIIPVCERIERDTAHLRNLNLNFLFCYGARQEIFSGIKQIMTKIKSGELHEDQLTPACFEQQLWTGGMPDPEMIVRTGGAKRLSNFMLYQAAYAEFYFLDCLWPELTTHDLEQALAFFEATRRNHGV